MIQKLLLAVTLILSTTWLLAQDTSSQTSPSSSAQAGSPTSGSSGQTSVEGCLQGSNGSFTLTDKSGTTYQLQGDTSKLADHVGHEVQITGTTSAGSSGTDSSGTSASAGGSSAGSQTLTVDKVKHVSKTCKEGAK
jgi:uncharacterized protein DUF5818